MRFTGVDELFLVQAISIQKHLSFSEHGFPFLAKGGVSRPNKAIYSMADVLSRQGGAVRKLSRRNLSPCFWVKRRGAAIPPRRSGVSWEISCSVLGKVHLMG